MIQLIRKEITYFFSSLTGILIIGVFMVLTGLFLWVVPGTWNIPISGYSNIDGLFELAPWLFLFLIPAITMGMFAEEFQTRTIELLLSRPVSRLGIVLSKYFAALLIVFIGITLTCIYAFSVSSMAIPVGNVDWGSIIGSYIALYFLGATYTAIGVFSSVQTSNQAVSFMLALALSYLLFSGFDLFAQIPFFKGVANLLMYFGMEMHYQSFSKGLLNSSDVVYFLSVLGLFLYLTYLKIRNIK